MNSEVSFRQKIEPILSKYFYLYPEVWSNCGKYRIDLIIEDKTNPAFLAGIEFKKNGSKRGAELGKWVQQCIRYSKVSWKNYGVVTIFLCPAISLNYLSCVDEIIKTDNGLVFKDRHKPSHSHHSVNGFLGQFGIGEVRFLHYSNQKYLILSISNKSVWDQRLLS